MTEPVKVFKLGAVQASIFNNKVTKDGKEFTMPKVTIQVRFKNKDNEWAGTNSFSIHDLPKAIILLQKAYEEILFASKSSDTRVETKYKYSKDMEDILP